MADSHLRPGWPALLPYLTVDDAQRLLDWLSKGLGAEIEDVDHREDGSIQHASVQLRGGPMLEVSDARPEFPARPGTLHWYVPDVDKVHAQAVAMGGKELMPPTQMDYGERSSGVEDPAGNHWYLAQYND